MEPFKVYVLGCGSAQPTREQLLQVVRDYYTAENRAFLQIRLPELEQSAVVYCSRYAPILVLELTRAQILGLSELEEVTLIDRFFDYDLIPEEPADDADDSEGDNEG